MVRGFPQAPRPASTPAACVHVHLPGDAPAWMHASPTLSWASPSAVLRAADRRCRALRPRWVSAEDGCCGLAEREASAFRGPGWVETAGGRDDAMWTNFNGAHH
eukprot:356120-Chlamydomonas_euryale.AAC.4